MNRICTLLITISICYCFTARSQGWEKLIGNPDSCCITGCSVKQLESGSVYVIGNNFSIQPNKIILAKLSAKGDTVFTRQYGIPNKGIYAEYLNRSSSNALVIAGNVQDPVNATSGYLILKVDTSGNLIWEKTYINLDKNAQLEYIEGTNDKGFIACGFITQPGNNANDFLVVKLDSLGNVKWENNYGFFENDAAHMVRQTNDSGYIVSGDTRERQSFNYDNYLIKLDKNGDMEWDLIIGDQYNNGNQSLIITSDGDYLLCGEGSTQNNNTSFDVVLVKVSKEGQLKWFKNLGSSGTEAGFFIIENTLKQYLITGYSTSYAGSGPYNIFLAKTDAEGNNLGVKYFQKPQLSIGYDLVAAKDGGYFITGTTGSTLYIIHTLDQDYTDNFFTSTVSTGLEENWRKMRNLFVFPNPARGQITIQAPAKLKYTIYNTLGQPVYSTPPNTTQVNIINTFDWPTGIYFIKTDNKQNPFSGSFLIAK